VSRYEDFLAAIDDPAHEEQEAMITWVGGVFDPDRSHHHFCYT
jgi:hypothetical protein